MALTSKVPPQAYTRDTLVKAIEWLSGQPPAVRERANSADLIVSHYLMARRQSGNFPSSAATVNDMAPVSQETFKADLKHLAEDLKKFEDPPSAPPQVQPHPSRSPSYVKPEAAVQELENIVSHHRQDSLFRQESLRQQEYRHEAPVPQQPRYQEPMRHEPQVRTTEMTVKGLAWNVDPRSLAIARELQETLNLSSEGEALRMLVKLGAERVKGLIS